MTDNNQFLRDYDAAAVSTMAGAIVVSAASIPPVPLDPVWPGVLWAGKPTLLCGDPGLGKSMLTADIAARVTTGAPWPCSEERREPAEVIMLSAEDDPADTLVPRLMAAGADLTRVSFISGVNEPRQEGMHKAWLSLDRHLPELREALRQRNARVRLIIIDPLSAYMGRDTDSHNEGEVRSVLSGLAELAGTHRCAILAIRHMRKSEAGNAQHRIIGSIAFTAAARATFVVTRDPDNEDQRLVLCAKNNLATDDAGYRYVIKSNDDQVPFIEWGEDRETRSIDEVMAAASPREAAKSDRAGEVANWMRNKLLAGPVPASSMWSFAEDAGYSRRDIDRAKSQLGVRAEIMGYQGAWHWKLPSVNGSAVQ